MLSDWTYDMKMILIATALAGLQPIYADEETCNKAVIALNQSQDYSDAVCIPMPEGTVRENERTVAMDQFFYMMDILIDLSESDPRYGYYE
jgi:hypothetical protein